MSNFYKGDVSNNIQTLEFIIIIALKLFQNFEIFFK